MKEPACSLNSCLRTCNYLYRRHASDGETKSYLPQDATPGNFVCLKT